MTIWQGEREIGHFGFMLHNNKLHISALGRSYGPKGVMTVIVRDLLNRTASTDIVKLDPEQKFSPLEQFYFPKTLSDFNTCIEIGQYLFGEFGLHTLLLGHL